MTDQELIEWARSARQNAYCPYSGYAVGAALWTGYDVYLGANVKVSGRSTSVHAEMMAAYNATLSGACDFRAMAVSTDDQSGEAICGLCQHTLSEFCDDLRILEDCGDQAPQEYWLSDLIGPAYSAATRQ